MAGIVVVFDFDKTIIDVDSDNWVIDNLGATGLFDRLLPTMSWNTLMDVMMTELHSQGKTIDDIAEVLKRAPLDPHVISAIRSAHAKGCDLRVVSDANVFFIETILKHYGIFDCFSEINTNPSYVDGEGRLRILPYHDFITSSHGCTTSSHGSTTCPPNMCKGKIIEGIFQASVLADAGKRFIYLGDGKGDYCPCLKLREGDCMMPRKNYPVWDLLVTGDNVVKAEVKEWSDSEDLERILSQQINKIIFATTNSISARSLLSLDCNKLQSIPNSMEALPKALPLRN